MEDEPPQSSGVQYAVVKEWRAFTSISRKMKQLGQSRKRSSVVDVLGGVSKVRCCKEQYCLGTWNFKSTNQGKLDMVKREMARVNTDILGISELK